MNITGKKYINASYVRHSKLLVADILLITAGIFSAGLGLRGFLLPNDFIDGGVTGISLLTELITGINLSYLLILINIPFVFFGYRQISPAFALRATVAVLGLALVISIIPYPQVTDDKLLTSVFGGFFLGAGIGLAMRGGAVLDGTEIAALAISKNTFLSVGDVILLFNIIIFGIAAAVINIETALYAILTYFSAARTVDFIIQGIEEYTAVTIISEQSEEIRLMIIEKLGRGVTVYKGGKGYGKRGENEKNIDIILCIVTRLEVSKLKSEVAQLDPQAFIIQHTINDSKGGMIKKRRLH